MAPAREFLRLLREAPMRQVLALLILMVLGGLSEGVGILLLVPLLDLLQSGQGGNNPFAQMILTGIDHVGLPPSPGGMLSAFLILVLARNAIQYGRDMLAARLQHRLVDTLRERCFAALLGAEWRWLATGRAAEHANLLLTDVNRVGGGLNYALNLLAGLATMSAYLVTAFLLSWPMALLAFASGVVILAGLSGHRRHALQLGQDLVTANRAMQGTVQDSLTGIKLAKILGTERRHLHLLLDLLSYALGLGFYPSKSGVAD